MATAIPDCANAIMAERLAKRYYQQNRELKRENDMLRAKLAALMRTPADIEISRGQHFRLIKPE